MIKLTQKEICKRILESEPTDRYIPAYEFVGEKKIDNEYYFLSYKAPARLSDLKNDGVVEWIWVTGRSGKNYQAFRIKR